MDTVREQRLLRIVEEALGLSGSERLAFLDEHCAGDHQLRADVEGLLGGSSDDWTLGAPEALTAIKDYVTRAGMRLAPGERVGPYRLKQEIGSGGMGVVYEAEQPSPRRTVALKLLHSRLVGTDAGRRFEYEAEILARLHHPHVAQVYEAGTYAIAEGVHVPWFAMELVAEAESITGYCEARSLLTHERLQLFVTVCEAIHHGHQLGVIHRDIKPANVLVDTQGRPKVIDFSVASATEQEDPQTMLTRTGDMLGTLPYMSPEQVSGRPDDVGTASDVYALGVLLYQLLTRRLPVVLDGLPLADSVKAITEQEPVEPSLVTPGLDRELDWVALKALEKDPERRYTSASELGADVSRFLAGEPVLAGAPSTVYRLTRAARRHPTAMSAVALIVVGAVAFGVYQSNVARAKGLLADAAEASALEAQENEAEALVKAAGIAAEQGDWDAVLSSLGRAQELGVGDAAEIGIQRVAGLISRGDHALASDELDDLEGNPGTSDLTGRVLMYRGIIFLADKETRDEAWPLLELAVDRSLPPADEAFVRGLLAPTSTASIAALREAIQHDPAHALAWSSLLNTLVFAGQLDDAEDMARALRYRLPRDKYFHAYATVFAGLSGDEAAMQAALDEARPWLSPADLGQVRDLAHWMLEFDGVLGYLCRGEAPIPFLGRALAFSMSDEAKQRVDEELILGSVTASTRSVEKSFRLFVQAMKSVLIDQARSVALIDEALALNPNPFFHLVRGMVQSLMSDPDLEAMDVSFREAQRLDMFPNAGLAARTMLLQTHAMGWVRDESDAAATQLMETLRVLEEHGTLVPHVLDLMATYASYVGAMDLAYAYLDRRQGLEPTSLAPPRLRMKLAIAEGDWWAARRAIDDLLARLEPESAESSNLKADRAQVVARLKSLVEQDSAP